jgi:hypothetical protein
VYNYLGQDEELSQWAAQIHAKYLVTTSAFNDDAGFLSRFVQRHSSHLDLVYANANFRLYRIHPFPDGLRGEEARP